MTVDDTAMQRLRTQLLQRWTRFPAAPRAALDELLRDGLARAATAASETITVTSPVSRSQRLRLATLVSDRALDAMYQQEWAELAVSSSGRCYLIYRRRDGGDYAIEWSPSTTLPTTMTALLPDELALAMLEGDDEENDPVAR